MWGRQQVVQIPKLLCYELGA